MLVIHEFHHNGTEIHESWTSYFEFYKSWSKERPKNMYQTHSHCSTLIQIPPAQLLKHECSSKSFVSYMLVQVSSTRWVTQIPYLQVLKKKNDTNLINKHDFSTWVDILHWRGIKGGTQAVVHWPFTSGISGSIPWLWISYECSEFVRFLSWF